MNALILNGSPKAGNGSTAALSAILAENLRAAGLPADEMRVLPATRSEAGLQALLDRIDAADLVVLAFPLYIDSLPAPLTLLLERIHARRAEGTPAANSRLAALVQCGFPEASQCDTAIGICRLFAGRSGFHWSGALAMGMGGAVGDGTNRMPGGGRGVFEGLGMAAASLANGGDISDAAVARFGKQLIPRWLYLFIGNLGWRIRLRRNRATRSIAFRPHA